MCSGSGLKPRGIFSCTSSHKIGERFETHLEGFPLVNFITLAELNTVLKSISRRTRPKNDVRSTRFIYTVE